MFESQPFWKLRQNAPCGCRTESNTASRSVCDGLLPRVTTGLCFATERVGLSGLERGRWGRGRAPSACPSAQRQAGSATAFWEMVAQPIKQRKCFQCRKTSLRGESKVSSGWSSGMATDSGLSSYLCSPSHLGKVSYILRIRDFSCFQTQERADRMPSSTFWLSWGLSQL